MFFNMLKEKYAMWMCVLMSNGCIVYLLLDKLLLRETFVIKKYRLTSLFR